MNALEVAPYLIAKSNLAGDEITNKKLQKLLYYVKAWGVVYFTDGVIDDDFEAWVHGPVCPAVYHEFKDFGFNAINIFSNEEEAQGAIDAFIKSCNCAEKRELIDAVFDKYAQLSSLQLELLTHQERPWLEAREGLSPIETGSRIISTDTMKNFYGKTV
mgnify:CR=1 FL=1